MQEPKPKTAAARRRWPLAVAIAALAAVLGTAGWAAYRMLDPVEDYSRGDAICHSTGFPDVPPGIITTPFVKVKPGRWLDVRSIGLVDGVNYRLAGTGCPGQGSRPSGRCPTRWSTTGRRRLRPGSSAWNCRPGWAMAPPNR